ncbi:MAG TPA: hypothetical protein VGG05_21140 [Pseudonocardiaceae bacterium]
MTSSWAVPDVHFSAAQRSASAEVVRRELGGPDVVGFAFLGGSLAVGLGHATSDVDLYAVSDDLPADEIVHESGGVTVHVSTVRADTVRKLVDLATEYRATGASRDQLYLDLKSLSTLVRLTTGLRVVVTPAWQSVLDGLRRDVVRKIFIARDSNGFVASAEDVAGSLAVGDRYTALGASTLALEFAAEAALAAADDLYWGPKFLLRRMARTTATAPWAPVVWRLLANAFPAGPPDDLDQVRRIAEQRLHVGNLLISCCALEGWDRPLTRLPSPDEVGVQTRSPYFAPIRFTDGWALQGPEHAYEVNEATVRLWRDLTPTAAGPGPAALAAIGAVGSNPPLAGAPVPPVPDLPADLRLRWAPRYAIHPRAERPMDAVHSNGGGT